MCLGVVSVDTVGVDDVSSQRRISHGRNVNNHNNCLGKLSGQVVWTETHCQQFDVRAAQTFLHCNVSRVAPSIFHMNSDSPSFLLAALGAALGPPAPAGSRLSPLQCPEHCHAAMSP